MKKLTQYNIKIVGMIFLVVAGLYFGSKAASYILGLESTNGRLHAELIGQKESYNQLTEHAAQLESNYVKQKRLAESAKNRFAEVIRAKNERIKLLSDATYLIGRHVTKQDGPDYYFETPRKTRNYVLSELRIAGKDSPALGYILIKNDGRTYKRGYSYEFRVEQLQTVDENTGRIKVYAKAFLVSKEKSPLAKRVDGYKNWKNIKYPLNITGGSVLVDPTIKNQLKPRFFWWAPHINANANFGTKYPISGLGVSLAGYGVTKNDLSYRLLQLGVQYGKETGLQGTIIPIMWRPFSKVLSNTYIGPGVVLRNGGLGYFLGVQVGF